ncbi:M1 family metallopeptidase [Syntrophomonas erecta subsp. sporosyntropha]
MTRRRLYLVIIIIGVICAAYFLYGRYQPHGVVCAPLSGPTDKGLFPAPDKTFYEMTLYLDINSSTIYGATRLNTENTSDQVLQDFYFTIYPDAFRDAAQTPAPREAYYAGFDPGWIEFDEINLNGKKVNYFREGVSLQLNPESDILPGQNIVVDLKWRVHIPRLAYRFGYKNGVYMLGNFYPILNVMERDGWHNSYNSFFGDPFCFHTANYRIQVSIPETYTLVSTGTNLERIAEDNGRQNYLIKADQVRDFCMVIMHDYNGMQKDINNTTVTVHVPCDKADQAGKILNQTGEILNFYSCTWGSYPYPEFNVVFVPMKGFHGMEYSGLIFLREEFADPDFQPTRGEFILAHEIAHQWWYGLVGNDQIKEPWLDEGLANWSAYKYLEHCRDQIPPRQEMPRKGNLARELSDIYSTQDYYLTAYNDGEAFWFGLEEQLGEEKINQVLRRYLAEYRFAIASSQDLLAVIKKEAHQDMNDYFKLWFPD